METNHLARLLCSNAKGLISDQYRIIEYSIVYLKFYKQRLQYFYKYSVGQYSYNITGIYL